jgi:hypothetical protein
VSIFPRNITKRNNKYVTVKVIKWYSYVLTQVNRPTRKKLHRKSQASLQKQMQHFHLLSSIVWGIWVEITYYLYTYIPIGWRLDRNKMFLGTCAEAYSDPIYEKVSWSCYFRGETADREIVLAETKNYRVTSKLRSDL